MVVFRITKEQYADDLSGLGAYLYGGRWNRPGTYALYTSEARSLALLELLVHFNSQAALKHNYLFISLEVPDSDIKTVELPITNLNNNLLNNEELWQVTETFFFKEKCLAIRVPSVIIPDEYHIIINPLHHDMSKIDVIKKQAITIDQRLFQLF
jgi:RES domain-containing protein